MSDWPTDIAADELIVRGICHPYHLNKQKIKAAAFKPPRNSDEVSVMRHDWIGADACKQRAAELTGDNKTYCGLAALRAHEIIKCGAAIIDSRNVFMGHADIKMPHPRPIDEPASPEITQEIQDLAKRLASVALL